MRVLIVLSAALAIASASVATVYTTQHDVPIGYTTSIEPKSSYEYQASVQTQDYNNYQSVKSVDPAHGDVNTPLTATTIEAQPAIIAEQPAVIAARTAPVVLPNTLFHAQQPVVVASQPQLIHTEAAAPAVIAARTVYDATPIVEETIVEAAPALQPVIRPIVRTAAPLIKTVQPATVYTSEPVVAVKTVDPTIYAERLETPIVEVEQRPAVAIDNSLLTVKSQYHSQDELGRAAYGHAEPTQSHNAYQDETGAKHGSFSYIAPNGRLLTTNYVADEQGYRAATNALPVPETPVIAVEHNRRRRSIGAVALAAPAPIVTKVAPYSYSSYRFDGIPSAYPLNSVAYTHTAPLAYSAVPTVYSAKPTVYTSVPAVSGFRSATLTNIVHLPGHAASYRVD